MGFFCGFLFFFADDFLVFLTCLPNVPFFCPQLTLATNLGICLKASLFEPFSMKSKVGNLPKGSFLYQAAFSKGDICHLALLLKRTPLHQSELQLLKTNHSNSEGSLSQRKFSYFQKYRFEEEEEHSFQHVVKKSGLEEGNFMKRNSGEMVAFSARVHYLWVYTNTCILYIYMYRFRYFNLPPLGDPEVYPSVFEC